MRPLVRFFVKYPIWANALILLIVVIGMMSILQIKRSYFPERKVNNLAVKVIYPGASPEEVEEGVTLKIENAVKNLAKVEEVSSQTAENFTIVTVGKKSNANIEDVLAEVKNAVDQINTFPKGAQNPSVYKLLPFNPAIRFILYGDEDALDLKTLSQKIRNDLLGSGIMSKITVLGVPETEISIEASQSDLSRYEITINEIANAIKANNLDISGGSVKTDQEELLIRSRAKTVDLEGIGNIVVRTSFQGGSLRVKDVAKVKLALSEIPDRQYYNGSRAISFQVDKSPQEDIIRITDYVKDYIELFNKNNEQLKIDIQTDRSILVNQRIQILSENGIVGLILVMISLSIFLNMRLAFWVAMGIPVSFMGMMIVAYMTGVTINQISLFGMILVIGILVDDGIVISENVYLHLEKGKTPLKAAVEGLMEVFPSVLTSVLTTIIAFVGLFFIEGYIGDFISEIAIVVIACLSVSLIEATLILPSHLGKKSTKGKETKFIIAVNNGVNYTKEVLYARLLRFVIKWKTLVFFGVPIVAFSLLVGLYYGEKIEFSTFPFMDGNTIKAELVLEQGVRETVTHEKLLKIEKAVWKVNDELREKDENKASYIISTSVGIGKNSLEEGGHTGEIVIKLLNQEEREVSGADIATLVKKELGQLEGVKKLVIGGRTYFGKPVSIGLICDDLGTLRQAKNEVKEQLESMAVLKDVIDDDVEGKREIQIKLKPKATYFGLTSSDVMLQIRQAFYGQEVQSIQKGEDEIKVWVRFPKADRKSISNLSAMTILTPFGQRVPFREVADYDIKREVVKISHYDGHRLIRIEASKVDPDASLEKITTEINDEILPLVLKNHPNIKVVHGGEERENEKFKRSRNTVLAAIILAIYIVMTLAFRSWSQPFIILFMIPFGAAGAFFGHYLHGETIVIMSQFGLIGLTGVIINDAVVFLDKYNAEIRNGKKIEDAVFCAGKSRFRAIMLTSVTTVLGLYPLIFETSSQAKFLIPMAISLTYGILFGTIFILVYFPVVILTLNDIKRYIWSAWDGKWVKPRRAEPAFREQFRIKRQEEI